MGSDVLGLALLHDSRVVAFARTIRNGLHISAQVVLDQLVGLVVGLGIPGLVL